MRTVIGSPMETGNEPAMPAAGSCQFLTSTREMLRGFPPAGDYEFDG
jgi:hypothetical protein